MNIEEIAKKIEAEPARSAWVNGVKEYAFDILDYFAARNIREISSKDFKEKVLNDARNWAKFPYDTNLIWGNIDIARRLFTEAELNYSFSRADFRPNHRETWSNIQTRAIMQAAFMINQILKGASK